MTKYQIFMPLKNMEDYRLIQGGELDFFRLADPEVGVFHEFFLSHSKG